MIDSSIDNTKHEIYMRRAIELAEAAAQMGEVPVGAVVVYDGQIIGEGANQREAAADPLGHAEMLALAQASKYLGRWRLSECTLYVTLEPCPMCAGALVNSRVTHLVYGARDPKAGAAVSLFNIVNSDKLNHRLAVTEGILKENCGLLLKDFFKKRRLENQIEKGLR